MELNGDVAVPLLTSPWTDLTLASATAFATADSVPLEGLEAPGERKLLWFGMVATSSAAVDFSLDVSYFFMS
jgi:hypothetical protein